MLAIMALGGLLAALSGEQPTGNLVGDILWTAGFAALVTWMGSRARPQWLLISAVAAFFFTGFSLPAAVWAILAVGLAFFRGWLVSRELFAAGADPLREGPGTGQDQTPAGEPIGPKARFDTVAADPRFAPGLGALVGLFITQAVLRLPNIRFVPSASIFAALAVAPLVYGGWRSLARPERRRIRRSAGLVVAFCFMGALGVGLSGLVARGPVESGIDRANRGIEAMQAADQPEAVRLLGRAEVDFGSAHDRLSGWTTWPGRWVPVVAQHARALETAAAQGEVLARVAGRTVTVADVDKIRGSNGAIDLEVVAAVDAELAVANAALREAYNGLREIRTPWLLPLLDSRLAEVDDELASTLEDIDLAHNATSLLPGFLGGQGPRTYLVLFAQPSEAREFGGFVGAYALLGAEGGRIELLESGSTEDGLTGPAEFTDPGSFPLNYLGNLPDQYPQNLTAIADLETIATAAADLLPQWRSDPNFRLDGVIALDPYAMAAMMELTGPVRVPGPGRVDSNRVVDFLLRDQYLELNEAGRDVRQDALQDLAKATFEQLLNMELPGPERLGALFGPLVRADRLSVYSFDPDENAFFARVFMDANMPQVGASVEMLGVYTQTTVASKLDGYSRQDLHYIVDFDPETGASRGRLEVALSNGATPDLPRYVLGLAERESLGSGPLALGSNQVAVALYTRSDVIGVDSPDAHFNHPDSTEAVGYTRHQATVEVPIESTRHVGFDTAAIFEPGRYDLLVMAQATANIGDLVVEVRPAEGWKVIGAEPGPWRLEAPLDTHRAISLEFERS